MAGLLGMTLGTLALSLVLLHGPQRARADDQWAVFPTAEDARKTSIVGCLRNKMTAGIPTTRRAYSQVEEDGVLEAIFSCIGTTNRKYAEFGTQSGSECSTRWLRENYGFSGLMMDGGFDNPGINLHREMIFAHNIADLFRKYQVEPMIDHLTVDIDQNTFWVAQALLHAGFRSRVLVMEINRNFKMDQAFTTVYMPEEQWAGDCYFGASLLALKRLADAFGYQLVYVDNLAVNAYFVHNTALGNEMGQQVLSNPMEDVMKHAPGHGQVLHGTCMFTLWLEVSNNVNLTAAHVQHLMRPALLAHKPEGANPRVFYEVAGVVVPHVHQHTHPVITAP